MRDLPTTETLVRTLATALPARLDDVHDWTSEVFKAAVALFPSTGCTHHAGRRTTGDGWSPEYLVDLCITDDLEGDADDPFTYRQVLLALECEWTPARNSLKYDFCKLVDTRAARRIFVGCVRGQEAAQAFVDQAIEFLSRHILVAAGEEYGVLLFASSPPTPHAWVLTKDGACATARKLN